MKKILLLAFVVFATDANAYCSRGLSLDYNDTINNEFKYLICLHNEQNASINQLTDVINNQRLMLINMDTERQRLQSRLDQVEREVESLRRSQQ